jgi:hypothetical protein
VEYGVKTGDTHPAGVQLFIYYWTKIFGTSEFSVRFPFAAAGVFSVLLIYLIGNFWFGRTCGLMAAAAMAALQFPLYYSQLARPYSSGLFFSLLLVYGWTKILFQHQTSDPMASRWLSGGSNILLYYFLFTISCALCLYNHYFSGMLAGIVAFTGLFFVTKKNWMAYSLCCIVSLLLFLPHISITFYQFSQKGLGWLLPPDANWLAGHFYFIFNNSLLVLITFFGAFLVCFFLAYGLSGFTKFHGFSLLFFSLPLIIGYVYSVWRSPVLQHSMLLFSYPYFLLLLFSFSNGIKKEKFSNGLVCFILAMGLFSTVIEKKYYVTEHHGDFKKLAQKTLQIIDKYGSENVVVAFNVITPYYIDYYFRKYDRQPEIIQYRSLEDTSIARLSAVIHKSKKNYFMHAWATINDLPEDEPLIKTKYPYLIERNSHVNAGLVLFSKKKEGSLPEPKPVFSIMHDFEINLWNSDTILFTEDTAWSGKRSANLHNFEFGPTWKTSVNKMQYRAGKIMNISVKVFAKEFPMEAMLIFTITKKDKTILWRGRELSAFITVQNEWQDAFLTVELPQAESGSELSVYVWNKKKKPMLIDDMKIEILK